MKSKVKVKVTLVQALRLCTGRTAHRGSRGLALLFLDHSARRGWGVSFTSRPLFNPGKDPVPVVQEVGWATGPVWTGAQNLASTEIRTPDRPASSQSLYRLLIGILTDGGEEWAFCSAGCAHYANFGAPSCVNIIKDGRGAFDSETWNGLESHCCGDDIGYGPSARPPRYNDSFINLRYWKIWRRHCCVA